MARNERLFKALQGLAAYLKTQLVKKVIEKGKVATGKGAVSIDLIVTELLDKTVITESHEDYMTFVDWGRKKGGKKVPIADIEQWLKQRSFSWAAANIRGAAFAVQTNIFKFGIKPSRWLRETLEDEQGKIESDVSEAVTQQMDIIMDDIVKRARGYFKDTKGVTITT